MKLFSVIILDLLKGVKFPMAGQLHEIVTSDETYQNPKIKGDVRASDPNFKGLQAQQNQPSQKPINNQNQQQSQSNTNRS